jgi:hypothetical protein
MKCVVNSMNLVLLLLLLFPLCCSAIRVPGSLPVCLAWYVNAFCTPSIWGSAAAAAAVCCALLQRWNTLPACLA